MVKKKPFLLRLYEILNEKENQEIIHWNSEGNGLIIENINMLSFIILPKYYSHNNYSSFVRQLNIYKFHKTKSKIISVCEELNKKNNLNQKMDINNKEKVKINNKENKNFFYFILYQITCGKNFNVFDVYQKFRKKIISEEHLIRNHLNVYNLLKYTERKRTRRNSYQLKDLIKLI